MARKNEGRVEVTEDDFGDVLIEGLEEVRAIIRGEAKPARQSRRMRTAREAGRPDAPPFPIPPCAR